MNQFLPRYFIPGYVLLMSMAGVSLLSCCKYGIHNRALSGTTFICIAMVLLLTGAARLTGWSRDTQGIIGNRKGSEAWAVAGQYLGQHLDAIAGDYWDVWPAVFATQQYRYEVRAMDGNVFGITYRGEVLHREFAANLAARGELRIGCIDLTVDACSQLVTTTMGISGLQVREFGQSARLPDNHLLIFLSVRPETTAARTGPELEETVALVDARLEMNRKAAA